MTYEEYKAAWNALTETQQQWVKEKARWEHMTRWAVMNEWDVPTTPDPRAADLDPRSDKGTSPCCH